ncbi:MAG: hypothetical protein ACI9ZQ_001410 [Porticoccaceae bacterium]
MIGLYAINMRAYANLYLTKPGVNGFDLALSR